LTGALVPPGWELLALYIWSFGVLSAAQLTIRLIMAFNVRLTLAAAVLLSLAAILISLLETALLGPDASLAQRIQFAPVTMLLMGFVGFAIARWFLRIKRLRGQIIAGVMVGLLDPHLFTLL
jgi:hypothetical protein